MQFLQEKSHYNRAAGPIIGQNPQGEEPDKRLAEFLSRRLLGVYTRNQYLCAD